MRVLRRLRGRQYRIGSQQGAATPAAVSFALDDDAAFEYRSRVPTRKLVYPSRRGGSPDNNAAITPIGIDEDPWQQPRQRLWNLARAFNDDEVYVNNAAEDYLWIAIQGIWQRPLVAFTDDEVLPTPTTFGLEDESHWVALRAALWEQSRPFLDDETSWFPSTEPVPDGGRGHGGRRRRRRPEVRLEPEEIERQERMLQAYLDELEPKKVAAEPLVDEPAAATTPRLTEVMVLLAEEHELELIASAEAAAEADRQAALEEQRRRALLLALEYEADVQRNLQKHLELVMSVAEQIKAATLKADPEKARAERFAQTLKVLSSSFETLSRDSAERTKLVMQHLNSEE